MNNLTVKALILATLALQPLLATADDDDRNRRGFANLNALEWRLGGAARGWQGQEIFYRYPGERQWRRAPGSARDVSDGWVIGSDRRNGGFGIYRWNGFDWQRMPGAGIDIGGSYNNPWVLNDRGERFSWTGYQWRQDYSNRGGRNDRDRDDRRDQDRDRRDNDWNDRDDRDGRDGRNNRDDDRNGRDGRNRG